jgi:diaminohydroxyphosphoribosylaminopyrimidine deaminase / 5-amino-6-(5-phosphoribosylamino)uracil reductase
MSDPQQDAHWMERALELAALGAGHVEPNPMVGCVLVRDGELLSEGYHRRFGGPHAEREAIAAAGGQDLSGATAYVTLEPCCHYGKTPPCTEALIAARVARVVCATVDPFAKVQGAGIAALQAAGIAVTVGPGAGPARSLNAPYFKRLEQGLPWIIAKWAMSLDGKLATRTGHSQWISGEQSRQFAHRVRGRVDAILTGSGTVLADDPQLTARPAGPRVPLRVVLDSRLRTPLDSQLVRTARETPVLLWCGPEAPRERVAELERAGCQVRLSQSTDPQQRLETLLRYLASERGASNVLVEAGSQLLGSLFDRGWMDECLVFIAPKLIGGVAAPSPLGQHGVARVGEGPELEICEHRSLDQDLLWRCRLRWRL